MVHNIIETTGAKEKEESDSHLFALVPRDFTVLFNSNNEWNSERCATDSRSLLESCCILFCLQRSKAIFKLFLVSQWAFDSFAVPQ